MNSTFSVKLEDVAGYAVTKNASSLSARNRNCRLALASEITSFCLRRGRKYCRTSSKARQKRWAERNDPKPSIG